MPKKTAPANLLPTELMPEVSSTELINRYLDRFQAGGRKQLEISMSMGVVDNFASMLRSKTGLPLSRIRSFAKAVQLSEDERKKLLHVRMMEMHGRKGEICMDAVAQWAMDLDERHGDDEALTRLWEEAISPAPHLLQGLLSNPVHAARMASAMAEVVRVELDRIAEEALEG